jgi:4-hydroxy-3-polyprenylbenzoate decarboxylase
MAGLATEASVLAMTQRAMPGKVTNFYAHPSGCGKYVGVLQFKKSEPSDEGRQRQAGLLALTTFPELKHVFLVDEDVDAFDSNDVLWAMATRYQADQDTIMIPGVRFHRLDPSACPEYNPQIRDKGITCKAIYDCTVPFDQKERFKRPEFKEVDLAQYQFIPVKDEI